MTTRVPPPHIKWLIGVAPEGSMLKVVFDTATPAGTVGRAEIRPDRGFFHPSMLELSADIEVKAAVYVMVDGSEVKLAEVQPGCTAYIDVDELFGEDFLSGKLILEGTTVAETTGLRSVNLKYAAGIYEFRGA